MSDGRRLDRDGALELLRSQHEFPGTYSFRIVVKPEASARVVSAIAAALQDGAVESVDERSSRSGKYTSLRVHTRLPRAEVVLDVYEIVGGLDGVIMTL